MKHQHLSDHFSSSPGVPVVAGFLPLEIPNYVHNTNGVCGPPIQTHRVKQKCVRGVPMLAHPCGEPGWPPVVQKTQKAKVGTSPSPLRGQKGAFPFSWKSGSGGRERRNPSRSIFSQLSLQGRAEPYST